MKQYTITFDVPDDFDPNELELTASYKSDIEISYEGFSDLASILKDKIELSNMGSVKDTDVVIFKLPVDMMGEAPYIHERLEAELGCKVLGLVNDTDVLVENQAEAIDMLNKMINTINLRSSIKIVK